MSAGTVILFGKEPGASRPARPAARLPFWLSITLAASLLSMQGAARQVELHQEQQKLKMNDVNYIRWGEGGAQSPALEGQERWCSPITGW